MATNSKTSKGEQAIAAARPHVLASRENRWLKEFRLALRGGLPTQEGFVGV